MAKKIHMKKTRYTNMKIIQNVNIYADKKYEIILSSVLIFWMLYYKTKF